MKSILVCFFFSSITFAQDNFSKTAFQNDSIQLYLKGVWHLSQAEVVDGIEVQYDSRRFTTEENRNQKITFTMDSLFCCSDSSARRFYPNQQFSYCLQFDSIHQLNLIKVYSGKQKKRQEVAIYEIVRCSMDELIIRSQHFINNGIDITILSKVYTYRKDGLFNNTQIILGEWYSCSTESNFFLTENDTISYLFQRDKFSSLCQKTDQRIELNFKRVNYENEVEFVSSNEYGGVMGKAKFTVDNQKQLIYITTNNDTIVYRYTLGDDSILTLSPAFK